MVKGEGRRDERARRLRIGKGKEGGKSPSLKRKVTRSPLNLGIERACSHVRGMMLTVNVRPGRMVRGERG